MKHFILFLFVVFLAVPIQSFAAKPAEQTVSIRIISQIKVQESKSSLGLFEGLTAEASALGLSEATIKGTISYTDLPNKSVRVKIKWHSLGMDKGGATEPLKTPLWSQFTVKDKKVEPGTQVTAKGDLEGVTTAFLALQEKLKSDTPRHLVDSKETNKSSSEVKLADNGIAPSNSGGSGAGSTTPPTSTSSDNSSVTTDLITTSWEACQPRIDSAGGMLYLQHRRTETNENGDIIDQGSCLDTGESILGTRNYSSCAVFIDYANSKVFEKYTLSGTVNNIVYPILDCTIDPDRFYNIQATFEQCGVRHDFEAGLTIEQERLYYRDTSGADIDVSTCQDSSNAYAQFLTDQTCVPTIDSANGIVFINKRTAYRLNDGTIQFANDCRPIDQAGTALFEEYCSPKYEHDFINNVSYYSTRDYYLDDSGTAQYVNTCSRSSTASFPHVFDTADCGVTNDDALFQTVFQAKRQIETIDDGVMEISACQNNGAPTSYAFLRRDYVAQPTYTTTPKYFNFPALGCTVNNSNTVEALTRSGIMWDNYNTSISFTPASTLPYVVTTYDDDGRVYTNTVYPSNKGARIHNSSCGYDLGLITYNSKWWGSFQRTYASGVWNNQPRVISNETTQYRVYMRGDASEYFIEDGSNVNVVFTGIP